MGDIEILLYDYCHPDYYDYLTVVMKKHLIYIMNNQLNDNVYDNSINYVCVYHDYCQLLPISIIINLRKVHASLSKLHIFLLAADLIALKKTSKDFPKNLVPFSMIEAVMQFTFTTNCSIREY